MSSLTIGLLIFAFSFVLMLAGQAAQGPFRRVTTFALPAFVGLSGLVLATPEVVPLLGYAGEQREWILTGSQIIWAFALSMLIAQIIRSVADVVAQRQGRPGRGILADLIAGFVYLLTGFIVLSTIFHEQVTGILATSGVIAVIITMTLQPMLRDFFAGFVLNLENRIKPGRWLQYGLMGQPPIWGRVDEVYWRATRLISKDGMILVVPNGTLSGLSITFLQDGRYYPVKMTFSLSGKMTPQRAKTLLHAAVLDCDNILDEPPPGVHIQQIDKGSVNYQVSAWTMDPSMESRIRDEISERVWQHLALAGFEPSGTEAKTPLSAADTQRTHAGGAQPILRATQLFAALTDEEVGRLAEAAQFRVAHPGEAIVREGDNGDSLFLVAQGLAYVTITVPHLGPQRVARFRPGDVFGEMSFLTGEPRQATVVAATELAVFELSRAALAPLLEERPALYQRLAELLAERRLENAANRSRLQDLEIESHETLVEYFLDLLKRAFGGRPAGATVTAIPRRIEDRVAERAT